jgi:hypothetical protein
MSSLSARTRWSAKGAVILVVGVLASFAPLPSFSFASVPVLERVELGGTAVAGAAELDELRAAVEAAEAAHVDEGETGHDDEAGHDHEAAVGEDRVAGVAADLAPFSTVGVLFDDVPTEPVLVRVQAADGTWGEWRPLGVELDEGPDADSAEAEAAGGRIGTEPIWVDGAVGYEVNVAAADASGAEVAVVRDETRRVLTESTPLAGAALPRAFDIRTRAEWGAVPASSTSYGSTIDLAVVHHSVSSNDYSPAQVPGVIRGIQAYHMQGRGWSDIAYNFVVDRFGGVWEGRAGSIDGPTIGAHAAGFNTNSVGVVVLGDYVGTAPSGAAVESVSRVVGWKLATYGVSPVGSVTRVAGTGSTKFSPGTTVNIPRVVGHGDVGATSCPGSISSSLGSIRQRAQDWAEWSWAASAPVGSVDGWGVGPGQVIATGWAADPDATRPMSVRLSVGGVSATASTSGSRPDVLAAFPFAGPNAGYTVVANGVPPGYQEACVVAVNQNFGLGDPTLGCRPVIVADPTGRAPVGTVDTAAGGVGSVTVAGGYSIAAPGTVTRIGIEVDGSIRQWVAPSGNGYSARVVGLVAGTRTVCAVAETSFGTQTRMNCRLATIGGASAIGSVDRIEYADGRIHVAGWALDLESVGAIPVAVTIAGNRETLLATWRRDDIAAAYPGYGPDHGFAASAPVGAGTHQVCVEFGGVGAGPNVQARCERVVVK